MSFSHINKNILIIITIFFLSSCSSQKVYEKIKIKKYEVPIVENFDEGEIILDTSPKNTLNLKNKILLKNFKNKNPYLNNIIINDDNVFAAVNNKLFNFDYNTGELISVKDIIKINDNDIVVSLNYINKSFIISYKSGSIFKLDLNGEIIWEYESKKLLNTKLKIFDEKIIALYSDEIKCISLKDGNKLWSESFDELPIYQAQGGKMTNFFNLIYFILPNNSVGAVDFNLGTLHSSKFDELPLISSINNTKDKIHNYENYIIYLDEGRYLYTFDIFSDEFLLFKENINTADSNIIFNNSIIVKEGNYVHAINSYNGQSFWIIDNKKISKNSSIIAIRNINTNIEIFLSNGDILIINNKEIIEIKNLGEGKIKKITFIDQNVIIYTKSGKTLIFKK
tara:strand:- start:219 stop:1403 length:1185 start_codon:yes stop_codon:yes gene_type:complete